VVQTRANALAGDSHMAKMPLKKCLPVPEVPVPPPQGCPGGRWARYASEENRTMGEM
jgi:hypothetical protein